jgi:transposase-like protein
MNEENTAMEGAKLLLRTLSIGSGINNKPYDDESEELVEFLNNSASITLQDIYDIGSDKQWLSNTRKNKAKIRYLSALLFNQTSMYEVAKHIHYILDNDNITIGDIYDILLGGKNDIPIEKIQKVGKLLYLGYSFKSIASEVGISYETIESIESFLGINSARKQRLISQACDAVREGVSVRTFAKQVNIPKSTAHTVMNKAKSVLRELGEIQ